MLAAPLSGADCTSTAWVGHQAQGPGSVTISYVDVPSVLLTVVQGEYKGQLTLVHAMAAKTLCVSQAVCDPEAHSCAARAGAKGLRGETTLMNSCVHQILLLPHAVPLHSPQQLRQNICQEHRHR